VDAVENTDAADQRASRRPQENARLLAHWRHTRPEWWQERAPYWRSLPPVGSIWRDLTFLDDQLRLLQDERLVPRRAQVRIGYGYAGDPGRERGVYGVACRVALRRAHAATFVTGGAPASAPRSGAGTHGEPVFLSGCNRGTPDCRQPAKPVVLAPVRKVADFSLLPAPPGAGAERGGRCRPRTRARSGSRPRRSTTGARCWHTRCGRCRRSCPAPTSRWSSSSTSRRSLVRRGTPTLP